MIFSLVGFLFGLDFFLLANYCGVVSFNTSAKEIHCTSEEIS